MDSAGGAEAPKAPPLNPPLLLLLLLYSQLYRIVCPKHPLRITLPHISSIKKPRTYIPVIDC